MAYEYREPDVVERHDTVVEDSGSSAGWAIVIVLAVLVVLGLIGYFAFANPNAGNTQVRVEQPADTGRAQNIQVNPPPVINNSPPPVINTPPPVINNNPPTTTGGGTTGASSTTTGG
jgi:hypothetical protein